MQIADSFVVGAPPEAVWAFLFDLEQMGECVPGLASVKKVDERTYRGTLKVKVGPVAAAFDGTATLTEFDPPRRLAAVLVGDDKLIASLVKTSFLSTLTAVEAGTEVAYQMEVNLRGRLAQFGTTVVSATAKKMTAEFAQNVRTRLES
jgi:carbon monoxide dehydrogenase subunit G